MGFFDIDNIFFTLLGYPVSYLEFFGLLSGVAAVVLSSFANVWYWPLGIINVVLSFFLFFQVQLYPDMMLQAFYFITNIIGWWRWTHPKSFEEDRKKELKITWLTRTEVLWVGVTGAVGTVLFGLIARNLHELLPTVFVQPSAAPFMDSFITVFSIIATFCAIQKKIETWIVWIGVDVVATYLYFVRDIRFYALLFLLFTIIAIFALWNWIREYRSYEPAKN